MCSRSVLDLYCVLADPLHSDETFLLSVVFLEELGATGNKGLTAILSNPVLANGVAGLATTATAFAAIEVWCAAPAHCSTNA